MASPVSAGLILSGAYIASGLISELGLLPPSFLPLANKRLYRWQAENLGQHVEKIYVAVPQNFQFESFDQAWLDEHAVNTLPLKEGKTLGDAVASCLTSLEGVADDIWILFGDTLLSDFSDLPPEAIAVGYVQEHSRWGYCRPLADGSIEFSEGYDANEAENIPVVAGCFRLTRQRFLECLERSGKDFYTALNLYSTKCKLQIVDKGKYWYDFGHINAYFRSRQHFTTERKFNNLRIEDRTVYKYSPDTPKIMAEMAWYENVPRNLGVFLPAYLGRREDNDAAGYATEYLFLPSLSDLFVYGRLPDYVWQQILRGCQEFLTLCRSYRGTKDIAPQLGALYAGKTHERLSQFSKSRDISLTKPWQFNGRSFPSLQEIFQHVLALVPPPEDKHISIVHGDFHFANIFFDFRALGVKVVDPRGMIGDMPTIYGDCRYDFAKLAHSVYGLYDFILAGVLRAKVGGSYEIELSPLQSPRVEVLQELFAAMNFGGFSWGDAGIRAIVILLFLSMLPLHAEDRSRQDTLLANVFRLYAELERGKT